MNPAIFLRPKQSEKAYNLSLSNNTYVFEVPLDSSKQSIARAVAEQFNVEVVSVNIINSSGKNKRTYLGKGRFQKGVRADVKKAYVSLKPDSIISIYPDTETSNQKPAKSKAKEKQ